MSVEKFKLDRIFWRKSLVSIFVALILYGVIMLALNCKQYQEASSRLENLSTNSVEQIPQEKILMQREIFESRQRRYHEGASNDVAAILLGLAGIIFVKRKTRK